MTKTNVGAKEGHYELKETVLGDTEARSITTAAKPYLWVDGISHDSFPR